MQIRLYTNHQYSIGYRLGEVVEAVLFYFW